MKRQLPTSSTGYQIIITLRGSKPPIWRRLVVPAEITLEDLHHIIQAAMGWYDSHLHDFDIDGGRYVGRSPYGEDMGMEGMDEAKYRLCEVVSAEKTKFNYQYDFGDSWDHVLLIEKIIPAASLPQLFVCLAGKGSCPPEDCGGIWGYCQLLETLSNPKHPEHKDMKEWIGGEFDPDSFDVETVNKRLAAFRGKGKRR